ncbi:hypothetical protein FF124_00190 [Martelella lutilitoris]|uniref:DUF4013 domain-containing protein n=1 Tax=Martelella lutilitoris TaxID=2583532 RepID=A0A5C4JVZ2_9HYPH|nr:hypothetical protein [Martelella lutilitoris]TNB49424.1 hypothetical protein FF124_00190 [Martelella lutilitoris]
MTFGGRLKAVMGGSLGLLFSNIVVALRIAWPWVLLAFLVSLFAPAEPVRYEMSQLSSGQILLAVLGSLAIGVVYIIAFCSVAVAWHRHGLLGEMPKPFPIRFARRELRFLGKSILVGLMMALIMVPLFAVVLLLGALSSNGDWFSLLLLAFFGIAGYFAVVALAMRYSLVLPATAVDRDFGVMDAFRHGEGFGLAMAITNVVIALLVALLSLALQFGLAALAALYLTVAPAALAPTVGAFVTVVAVFFSTVTTFFTIFSGLAVVTTGYRIAGESRGYDIFGNRLDSD